MKDEQDGLEEQASFVIAFREISDITKRLTVTDGIPQDHVAVGLLSYVVNYAARAVGPAEAYRLVAGAADALVLALLPHSE
jgi:hypothetical protein